MKKTKSTIPSNTRKAINESSDYQVCMLYGQQGHVCEGRLTKEHAIIHAGRSCQAQWAILSICAKGHSVDQFQDNHEINKELHEWIAYSRASDEDLFLLAGDIPGTDPNLAKSRLHFQKKKLLIQKYKGVWEQRYPLSVAAQENSLPSGIQVPENNKSDIAEKPFWFPVSRDLKAKIRFCINFHMEVEDLKLTPFQMIEEMIDKYFMDIKELQEFGTVSTGQLINQRHLDKSIK